ncbi:MAG: ribulose-phosphate 3-epimerase [Spirochaeta sp.]|nr:ribulose-phosphate 3-epimerase [Spirochaeta sp.]
METRPSIIIAPSILAADFSCLAAEVHKIEQSGADWLHFDIMDGSFVPVITFGHQMVAALRKHTRLPIDAHLMVMHPETMIEEFALAGADYITIHQESTVHIHRVLTSIIKMGKKAGISIIPSTPVSMLLEILHMVDIVLVMTVNPGFGGQTLIQECLRKVEYLSEIKKRLGYRYLIQVDGGINSDTRERVVRAGAEVLVAGSAIFKAERPELEINLLKEGE